MYLIRKKEIKNIGLFLIFLFIIFKFFNTPYNFYSILNWSYEKRMVQNYGFCKNESWGFYNLVVKKYDLKNQEIKIINDEGHVTLENLFGLKKKQKNNVKYLMVLNYQSVNNEDIMNSNYNYNNKYKLVFRKNNCYLLEAND
tara:strand:+ start:210 stop:635 length:426 start_codon:yes stop_codon:yes gene_type:complete